MALKLRQITFGNKVRGTIICQNQSCGKKMDIDFNIDDIPIIEKMLQMESSHIDCPKRDHIALAMRDMR